ncbi:MAG TPA: sugar ABC transporter permease [Terriglobales bacterium]|nr:sugar ABC transporter permease [Terriglobales bacterium]
MNSNTKTMLTQPTGQAKADEPKELRWQAHAGKVRAYSMVFALIALWIIFTVVTDGIFLGARNFSNLIRQTAVTGILSVGMVMVIITGQIDLSVGSIVGLSGMAAVLVQVSLGWGLVPSLLTGIMVGLAIGALQGWLAAYARVPSFIVTLGGLLVWRGVAKGISGGNTYPIAVHSFKALGQSYLSQTSGIVLMVLAVVATIALVFHRNTMRKRHGLEPWTTGLAVRILLPSALIVGFVVALNAYAGVPIPVLIFVTVALVGAFATQNTTFGRYLYAVGGNPEAAKFSGINLRGHVLATFCILGALSGIAGIIYTARVGSAGPDAGTLLELDAIAACVIGGASLMGGRGSVLGACLGALFMASLDNGMSLKNVPDFTQDIVKGSILVVAVGLDVFGRRKD